MSTRSTTHFVSDGETRAIVYRHSDGYPEGHGVDLQRFLDDVEAQTADTRFNDPSYLAAKLVVWLADLFGQYSAPYDVAPRDEIGTEAYDEARREWAKAHPLAFLSVGVMMEDPSDIEYLYEVDCSAGDPLTPKRPEVRCYENGAESWRDAPCKGAQVEIPSAVAR